MSASYIGRQGMGTARAVLILCADLPGQHNSLKVPIMHRVLIIAGSDSGGGAGIQADIKTVTCLGGYAMTAITALTVQNTLGVADVMGVPAGFIIAQARACL